MPTSQGYSESTLTIHKEVRIMEQLDTELAV
jgi:hypothetical protein